MTFYMNVFLLTNIETSCWAIQNMEWSSVLVYPGLLNSCSTMFTCHCWYNVHKRKTSKILVFKLIRYHHELPCTLNSVVFELSFCLLFLKSIMITIWVRSSVWGDGWIMISDPRSLSWFIKGADESVTREDSSVPLIHQWSWITDLDPDEPRDMHPLSLLNFLLNKPSPGKKKTVYLIGFKIISNVNKHNSTYMYDSLKYCLCSDFAMCLSFFSNSSICNPIATYLNLTFL